MLFTRRRLFAAIAFVGVVLLSGCATLGPVYAPESAPPADKATIYVYRDSSVIGSGVSYMVSANGIPLVPLPAGGYFVYRAAPGEMEFSASTEAKTSVTVDAKGGEVYYVKGTIGVGVFVGHPHLVLVSKDVGQKEIASCKLVPGSTAITQNSAQLEKVAVPSDEGAVTTYGSINWYSGVDALASGKVYGQAVDRALHGTLELTDRSLTLLLASEGGSRTGTGLHIPYSDIASIEISHYGRNRAVVIKRRDGRLDSFQIVDGIFVDRKQTVAAGELLHLKVQAQPVSPSQ